MRALDPAVKELRELFKQKRRLLDKMKKHRKSLAKLRVEKRRINSDISKLRKSNNIFGSMTAVAAMEKVTDEIKSVRPNDIYPRDLEKEFDKLEQKSAVKHRNRSVNLDDLEPHGPSPKSHPEEEDTIDSIGVEDSLGVIDLSEDSGSEDEEYA